MFCIKRVLLSTLLINFFVLLINNTVILSAGWAGKLQTFSQETDNQKRVLMVDALDLELIERTQPAYLKDLLQSIDLINMPIIVDRTNITGKKSVLRISFHGEKVYY